MPWSLVLDLLMTLLLIVTIGYAVSLNRRLMSLRRQRAELEGGITDFHHAVKRAEESIAQLRFSTEGLQARVDQAATVQSDLSFLVERGDTLADRLEAAVRAARDEDTAATVRPASRARRGPPPPRPLEEPRSETERELLKALAGGQ